MLLVVAPLNLTSQELLWIKTLFWEATLSLGCAAPADIVEV